MNAAVLKMLTSMVSPEDVSNILDDLLKKLIEYKNSFALENDEEASIIILFEDEKTSDVALTIAAIDSNNRITRQIQTDFVKSLFINMLKQEKNAKPTRK